MEALSAAKLRAKSNDEKRIEVSFFYNTNYFN